MSVDSSSRESYSADSRQASRQQNTAKLFMAKTGVKTSVVNVDVKTAKKRISQVNVRDELKKQKSTERKATPKGKRLENEKVSRDFRPKASSLTNPCHPSTFEAPEASPSLFLSREETCFSPKSTYKALTSSYKLTRPARRPASLDLNAPTNSSVAPGSLVQFMQEVLEENTVHVQRRTPAKLLQIPSSPKSSSSALLTGPTNQQKEKGKRGIYSIKTAQSFRFGERDRRLLQKDDIEGKSRAERSWAWRGKRGSLREATIKALGF